MSRVTKEEPTGWNPTKKANPRVLKKKRIIFFVNLFVVDPNSILVKHRKFLKSLEEKKMTEKDIKFMELQQ